jgi:hypothetical protein
LIELIFSFEILLTDIKLYIKIKDIKSSN